MLLKVNIQLFWVKLQPRRVDVLKTLELFTLSTITLYFFLIAMSLKDYSDPEGGHECELPLGFSLFMGQKYYIPVFSV